MVAHEDSPRKLKLIVRMHPDAEDDVASSDFCCCKSRLDQVKLVWPRRYTALQVEKSATGCNCRPAARLGKSDAFVMLTVIKVEDWSVCGVHPV